jgi:hypothetical protein
MGYDRGEARLKPGRHFNPFDAIANKLKLFSIFLGRTALLPTFCGKSSMASSARPGKTGARDGEVEFIQIKTVEERA